MCILDMIECGLCSGLAFLFLWTKFGLQLHDKETNVGLHQLRTTVLVLCMMSRGTLGPRAGPCCVFRETHFAGYGVTMEETFCNTLQMSHSSVSGAYGPEHTAPTVTVGSIDICVSA